MARLDYKLIAAVVAPLLVWPWMPPWDGRYLGDGPINAVSLILLMALAEEALFRGLLQGWLLRLPWFARTRAGVSRANIATSCAFVGAHMLHHPLFLFPGYFAVSLVFGCFRERYHGILVPALLHGYYNLGLWAFSG